MTYDLILTEINTQGLDSDLNGNFTAIEDAVNAKAKKNGDGLQKFNVADATESTNAVNKGQLDTAVSTINSEISDLEIEVATKASITYVDEGLATKINTSDTTVTKQGNTFNGANQLVQLNSSGQLPALNGSLLSGLAHEIPANTTIYISTTGSDTTGDGSSSAPYATLTKALSFLNGKMLLGAVTIQLADGTYLHTSLIKPGHPQGDLITIRGNTSDRTAVELSFTDCYGFFVAPNITTNLKYLTISGNRTTGNYGFFSLGHLSLDHCKVMNFYTGIAQEAGCADLRTVESTNNLNNGIDSFPQGFIYANNLTSTYNGCYGVYAHQTGSVDIDSGIVTNNTNYGLCAVSQGHIDAYGTTINYNTAGAMFACNLSLIATDSATTYSGNISPTINTQGNCGSYILH